MSRFPLGITLAFCFLLPPALAQPCTSFGSTLGSVTVVSSTQCSSGPNVTTCKVLRINCPSVPEIFVDLRIIELASGVNLRGTVVMGTGGGGQEFYSSVTGGSEVQQALLAEGFRIIERKWSFGWWGNGHSTRMQSCRYATLLQYLHQNEHPGGAFCATGNSGGSAEIAYALTTWGMGSLLDVAVLTGGPPLARLDLTCNAGWNCTGLVQPGILTCGPLTCTRTTSQACFGCGPHPTAQQLHADSILHPNATLSFPGTRVHQILGTADCTVAAATGGLFHAAVQSEKVREYVDAPHWVPEAALGRDAIVRAIFGGAHCGAGVSVLLDGGYASVGGTLQLTAQGQPGAAYGILLGSGATMAFANPYGWFFLVAPTANLGSGNLDAMGQATHVLVIPNDPALQGASVFAQSIAGNCLSNLSWTKVL